MYPGGQYKPSVLLLKGTRWNEICVHDCTVLLFGYIRYKLLSLTPLAPTVMKATITIATLLVRCVLVCTNTHTHLHTYTPTPTNHMQTSWSHTCTQYHHTHVTKHPYIYIHASHIHMNTHQYNTNLEMHESVYIHSFHNIVPLRCTRKHTQGSLTPDNYQVRPQHYTFTQQRPNTHGPFSQLQGYVPLYSESFHFPKR